MKTRWLSPFVASVVCLGWLFALGIGAVEQNWTALTATTPVMLIVVGAATGIKITKTKGDDDGQT